MAEPLEAPVTDAASTPDPVASTTPAPDTTTTSEPDTFSREYVQELRREAAGYRERAKAGEQYSEIFGAYSDEDRAAWLELGKAWKDDPKTAAANMKRIAEAALEQYVEQMEADNQPLTRAEYKAMQEQAVKAAKEAETQARIEHEAASLGYSKDSLDYEILLLTAARTSNGDIKAAHEALRAQKQKAIDEFLAQKAAEAEGSPKPPVGSGGAASTERKIDGWNSARASLEARIAAARK